jgi:hypothetical protein
MLLLTLLASTRCFQLITARLILYTFLCLLLTLLLIQHGLDVLPRLHCAKAEVLPWARQLLGGTLLQDTRKGCKQEFGQKTSQICVMKSWHAALCCSFSMMYARGMV